MKKYRVYASYVVELCHDIEAESQDEAWDKVYNIDGGDFIAMKDDNWQIDRIEEIKK